MIGVPRLIADATSARQLHENQILASHGCETRAATNGTQLVLLVVCLLPRVGDPAGALADLVEQPSMLVLAPSSSLLLPSTSAHRTFLTNIDNYFVSLSFGDLSTHSFVL